MHLCMGSSRPGCFLFCYQVCFLRGVCKPRHRDDQRIKRFPPVPAACRMARCRPSPGPSPLDFHAVDGDSFCKWGASRGRTAPGHTCAAVGCSPARHHRGEPRHPRISIPRKPTELEPGARPQSRQSKEPRNLTPPPRDPGSFSCAAGWTPGIPTVSAPGAAPWDQKMPMQPAASLAMLDSPLFPEHVPSLKLARPPPFPAHPQSLGVM